MSAKTAYTDKRRNKLISYVVVIIQSYVGSLVKTMRFTNLTKT